MNDQRDHGDPPDPLRALRHDIRGRMNALVLCATALDETVPRSEALEFLTHIEETAEKLASLLDQLDAMG